MDAARQKPPAEGEKRRSELGLAFILFPSQFCCSARHKTSFLLPLGPDTPALHLGALLNCVARSVASPLSVSSTRATKPTSNLQYFCTSGKRGSEPSDENDEVFGYQSLLLPSTLECTLLRSSIHAIGTFLTACIPPPSIPAFAQDFFFVHTCVLGCPSSITKYPSFITASHHAHLGAVRAGRTGLGDLLMTLSCAHKVIPASAVSTSRPSHTRSPISAALAPEHSSRGMHFRENSSPNVGTAPPPPPPPPAAACLKNLLADGGTRLFWSIQISD